MNTEINLGNPAELASQSLIELPTEYIVRNEQCPVCKISLHESFRSESDKPKDPMRVQFGRKYRHWLVSDDIFCPTCKMKFKHLPTDSAVLGRYKAIAEQGGIYKLCLAADFLISRFDTPLKKSLKKGTIVYAEIDVVAISQKKPTYYKTPSTSSLLGFNIASNFLFELKKGYKKSDGWTEGKIPFRKAAAWKQTPAVLCVLKIMDLFTSESKIELPAHLVVFHKEMEK